LWPLLIDIKNKVLRKPSSKPVWETPNSPPNINCVVPACFGDCFVSKEGDLWFAHTHNPYAEEIGEWRYFCIKRLIILNADKKIQA
jgi:hypothetical protein